MPRKSRSKPPAGRHSNLMDWLQRVGGLPFEEILKRGWVEVVPTGPDKESEDYVCKLSTGDLCRLLINNREYRADIRELRRQHPGFIPWLHARCRPAAKSARFREAIRHFRGLERKWTCWAVSNLLDPDRRLGPEVPPFVREMCADRRALIYPVGYSVRLEPHESTQDGKLYLFLRVDSATTLRDIQRDWPYVQDQKDRTYGIRRRPRADRSLDETIFERLRKGDAPKEIAFDLCGTRNPSDREWQRNIVRVYRAKRRAMKRG